MDNAEDRGIQEAAQRLRRAVREKDFEAASRIIRENLPRQPDHHYPATLLKTLNSATNEAVYNETAAFICACTNGGGATLELMIDRFGPPCLMDQEGLKKLTPLHMATRKQSVACIRAAARDREFIPAWEQHDSDGNTPLHELASFPDEERVDIVLDVIELAGAECLNSANKKGETILHKLIKKQSVNSLEKVAEILPYRGDGVLASSWKKLDACGNGAAHFAAENTHDGRVLLKVIEWLGPDCLKVKNKDLKTPLYLAAQNQADTILEELHKIADAAAWSECDKTDGYTPAHCAAMNERIALLVLSWPEVDVANVRDQKQRTPLHLAVMNSSVETIISIIDNIYIGLWWIGDEIGNTPLHYLAEKNANAFAVFDKFFRTQNDMSTITEDTKCFTVQNKRLQTPMHFLLKSQSTEKMRNASQLLKKIDIGKLRDYEGETPVHYAARNVRCNLIELKRDKIICENFDRLMRSQNKRRETPLHVAVRHQREQQLVDIIKEFDEKLWKLEDMDGKTVAHLCAKHATGGIAIKELARITNNRCLQWENARQQTPFLLLLRYQDGDAVSHFVKHYLNADIDKQHCDADGNMTLHYYAKNGNLEEDIMRQLMQVTNEDQTLEENNREMTALHYLAGCQNDETIRNIINNGLFSREQWLSKDAYGNTPVHYLAKNRKLFFSNAECIQRLMVEISGCLELVNKRNQTPLHFLALHQSPGIIGHVVSLSTAGMWALQDSHGDTPVHFGVQNKEWPEILFYGTENTRNIPIEALRKRNDKQVTPLHHVKSRELLEHAASKFNLAPTSILDWRDDKGRNIVLYACANGRFRLLFEIEQWINPLRCINSVGRSPLHALFWSNFAETDWIKAFNLLLSRGCDVSHEDMFHQTSLHSCRMTKLDLRQLMKKIADLKYTDPTDPLPQSFARILRNSNGVHAVHAFAGRYDLEYLVQPLADVSGYDNVLELLNLMVTGGDFRGATCLHFACETGHKENIQFLLRRGMKLQATTHSGQSCIDFAVDKGKLTDVIAAANGVGFSEIDVLRLTDVAKRALSLPDSSHAYRQLAAFTDVEVAAEGSTQAGEQAEGAENAQTQRFAIEEAEERTDCKILMRAMQLDSTTIIRSSLSLELLNSDTETYFPSFFRHRIEEFRAIESTKKQRLPSFLPKGSADKIERILRRGGHHATLVEIAALLEKLQIIPDLLLIRQFDLIPSCLELLVRIEPKIKSMQGKHEQLKELKSKVTSIVVNALNELYFNAEDNDRDLLLNYLKGELKGGEAEDGEDQPAKSSDRKGPKFIFNQTIDQQTNKQTKVKEESLLQKIEDLNSGELLGTECLHQLAKQQWNERKAIGYGPFMIRCSAFDKFISNSVGFILFLMYFAWFVTDFCRTFESVVLEGVLLAYTLSYTMQEMHDMWRRRHMVHFFILKRTIRLPVYCRDMMNVFDVTSIVFMWIGSIWRIEMHVSGLSEPFSHACQMMLTTSFLLWGFRSVGLLNYFEMTGPVNSILRKLLIHDLLPFLVLLFIIFYSSGLFFVNLLFPVSTSSIEDGGMLDYAIQVVKLVFTLPSLLLFGYFERTDFVSANVTNQLLGDTAHPLGLKIFNNFLVFVFLLCVNIVMVNLLIAMFNLTVSRMEGKARSIWRRKYFEMLREYENLSIVPPPLSCLVYLGMFIMFAVQRIRKICRAKCCTNRRSAAARASGQVHYSRGSVTYRSVPAISSAEQHSSDQAASNRWWRSEFDYCQSQQFMKFLRYQAMQFRRARPLLTRSLTTNRGDFEQLKASNENSLADTNRMLDERVYLVEEKLDDKVESLTNTVRDLADRMDKQETNLSDRMDKQETNLADRMDKQETNLSDRMDKQETNLSDRMDKQETNLADRMDKQETNLVDRIIMQERKTAAQFSAMEQAMTALCGKLQQAEKRITELQTAATVRGENEIEQSKRLEAKIDQLLAQSNDRVHRASWS